MNIYSYIPAKYVLFQNLIYSDMPISIEAKIPWRGKN